MLALALGLIGALGWGTHDALVRWIAPGARILPQVTVVMGVGAVLVAPLLLTSPAPLADPRAVLAAVLAGAIYFVATWSLYAAFARAPARIVVPLVGAYPLPALAMAAALGTPITAQDWGAAGLIVAGLAVVALQGEAGPAANRRAALIFSALAGLGLATSFTIGQWAQGRIDGFAAPAISRIAAAAVAAACLVLARQGLPRAGGRVLAGMGVMDGIALTAVLAAGTLAEAHYASVVSSLYGLVTVPLAWIFLGERVTPRQGLGIALTFAGVAWLALG